VRVTASRYHRLIQTVLSVCNISLFCIGFSPLTFYRRNYTVFPKYQASNNSIPANFINLGLDWLLLSLRHEHVELRRTTNRACYHETFIPHHCSGCVALPHRVLRLCFFDVLRGRLDKHLAFSIRVCGTGSLAIAMRLLFWRVKSGKNRSDRRPAYCRGGIILSRGSGPLALGKAPPLIWWVSTSCSSSSNARAARNHGLHECALPAPELRLAREHPGSAERD